MKKRSLFAAVAMLIVSAMVLTSATYAWFVSGGDASVSVITGATMTAGTGVQLKSTDTSTARWKNTLTSADFTAATDVLVATATNAKYHPVTSEDGVNFKAYSINSSNQFSEETIGTAWYDVYSFYVGTVNANDGVQATLTIGGDAASAARVAVFLDGTLNGIYSGATESNWLPIIVDLPANTPDTNNNKIADENDSGLTYSYFPATGTTPAPVSTTNASGGARLTSNTTGADFTPGQVDSGTNTLVKVVVWLEGNDSNCTAYAVGAKASGITTAWSFHAIAPTT